MAPEDIVELFGAFTALITAIGGIVIALYRLHLRITELENNCPPPPKG